MSSNFSVRRLYRDRFFFARPSIIFLGLMSRFATDKHRHNVRIVEAEHLSQATQSGICHVRILFLFRSRCSSPYYLSSYFAMKSGS